MHCSLCLFHISLLDKVFSCFRQAFFLTWETKKKLLVTLDRWLSYTVTIKGEFAWADSALIVLDKWLSYRGVPIALQNPCFHHYINLPSETQTYFFFPFFGKLNSPNMAVYLLTCPYFGRMEKNMTHQKVGLHFANF